ncbi:hypothetical protein SCHPADRAFT_946496 [Schizopora paradoxa]|uniref:BAH domain-containing protein n=1 Tax=Schizopora paradoxa TaxID=27342 RepID=A0A0H2R926_9AGAM|nr:hypothetical protein SCHPADRAFT_946496 [Schizopora paradoxa]
MAKAAGKRRAKKISMPPKRRNARKRRPEHPKLDFQTDDDDDDDDNDAPPSFLNASASGLLLPNAGYLPDYSHTYTYLAVESEHGDEDANVTRSEGRVSLDAVDAKTSVSARLRVCKEEAVGDADLLRSALAPAFEGYDTDGMRHADEIAFIDADAARWDEMVVYPSFQLRYPPMREARTLVDDLVVLTDASAVSRRVSPDPDGPLPFPNTVHPDLNIKTEEPEDMGFDYLRDQGIRSEFKSFQVGDVCRVIPVGKRPDAIVSEDDYQIVEIKDIRGLAHDPKRIYALVKQYWSRRMLRLTKNRENLLSILGSEEVVDSDFDVLLPTKYFVGEHFPLFADACTVTEAGVRLLSPEDHTRVIVVRELNFMQDAVFGPYTRLLYDHGTGKMTAPPPMCVCKKPYAPDRDFVRLCVHCREFYHEHCVLEGNAPRRRGAPNHATRMERSVCSPSDFVGYQDMEIDADYYEFASVRLLEVARSPLVRGGWYGYSGNVRTVLLARELLARAVIERTPPRDDWQEDIGMYSYYAFSKTVRFGGRDHRAHCPKCKAPI